MEGIFTNHWWATVASDFSVSIFLLGSLILCVLNIWATIHPEAKSIICLIKGWVYGFPGMKKEESKDKVETS